MKGILYRGVILPLAVIGYFIVLGLSIPYWIITGKSLFIDYSNILDKIGLTDYIPESHSDRPIR